MIMKKLQKAKGITLIALVITIVVLLILAAVTINLTLGERGIFNVAQKAAKNYTDANQKEEKDLQNFEKEVNETIKNATTNTLASQITAANYGDYVNYEDGLDLGSSEKGYSTDWRIFYKDKEGYVYLITSYLLRYSDLPSGTNLKGSEENLYTSYWTTAPNTYTDVAQSMYDRYMMNFKVNGEGSPNNGYDNMKCVSELMDTTKWTKFVNTGYAEDAVGSPTMEMWIASWNEKSLKGNLGWTKLVPSKPYLYGYYLNGGNVTDLSKDGGYNDTLYFLNKNEKYWLATPSVFSKDFLKNVTDHGTVNYVMYNNSSDNNSIRPIVRLKNKVHAQKVNGIWKLE